MREVPFKNHQKRDKFSPHARLDRGRPRVCVVHVPHGRQHPAVAGEPAETRDAEARDRLQSGASNAHPLLTRTLHHQPQQ